MDIKWKNSNSGKVAIGLTLVFVLAVTVLIGGFNNMQYYRQFSDMEFQESEEFHWKLRDVKNEIWILGNGGDWNENRHFIEQAEEEKRRYQRDLENVIRDYDSMILKEGDELTKQLWEKNKAQAIADAQSKINLIDPELKREIEKNNQDSVEEAKNELSSWRNVKYIVVNHDNNTMFTNTKANSLEEFEQSYRGAASSIGSYPVGVGQLATNRAYYEVEHSNTGRKNVVVGEEKATVTIETTTETVATSEVDGEETNTEEEVSVVEEENQKSEEMIVEEKKASSSDFVEEVPFENWPLDAQLKEEGRQDNCTIALFIPAELVPGDGFYDAWRWHSQQANGIVRWSIITLVAFIFTIAMGFIFNENRVLLHQAKQLLIAFSKKNPLEIKGIVTFFGYIYITHLFISYSIKIPLDFIFAALIATALLAYVLEFLFLEDKRQFWKSSYLMKKNIHLRFNRVTEKRIYMTNDVQKAWKKKYILFAIVMLCVLVFNWVILLCGFFGMEGNLYEYEQAWYRISEIALACLLTSGIAIVAIAVMLMVFYRYSRKEKVILDHIIEGTERIKQGDTDYVIEEEGNHTLTTLAHNINNIREGLDVAIANEVKSQKMKTELITNVSHDLKTPLTSIINYANLLQQEELSPEHANEYVEIIVNKSDRLKVLIQDLFEVSKAASGNMDVNIQPIQLQGFLEQVLAETENHFEENGLLLKVSVPEEPITILADGDKLWRVMDNLLNNAKKYSLLGTRVYLDVVSDDQRAKITLKNISGYEMNFDAEEITERFKRGDESRSTEGSGLGLAIAKSLTDLQDIHMYIHVDGDLFKVELEIPTERQLKVES